ncbi:MAG: hypothetical protein U9R56_05730, partial [candidate division Zixibacteria bacterium]|nr:hypothetical protein [candidate division Zixibacteria bacterium]
MAQSGEPDSGYAPPKLKPPVKSCRTPNIDYEVHRNGRLWTTVNNNGVIGNIFGFSLPDERKTAPTLYYPGYSRIQHGYYVALWVGGVVGEDTLVTTAMDPVGNREFWPDYYPFGEIQVKTNEKSPTVNLRSAREVEFHAVYTDTFEEETFVTYNTYDNRQHKPLNIAVMQTSYSWSYEYAEDIMIVDYIIMNLGTDTINSAWVGIYYNGCIHHRGELPYPMSDDLEGYIYSAPYEFEEIGDELLRIAYIVDKDGYAGWMGWDFVRTPHAFGIVPLKVPKGAFVNNFNWWTPLWGNWGPRMTGTYDDPFRPFFGGLGVPYGDKNKYYLMSKPELDYCGFEAGLDHTDDGWMERTATCGRIAKGHQVNFVTSFGPFTLAPTRSDTFSVAMVIGNDVHTNPDAYRDLYDIRNPKPYMDYLDFDDLINNVRWAKLIYDNPGIDTDGDGDSGKWFLHYDSTTLETIQIFYEGDGVPDFKGASAPPPPQVRIRTEEGRIILRWNGHDTENHIDPMTFAKDFEGYRVYISRSRSEQEAVLLASYDREDYNRYVWNEQRQRYELLDVPFTADSLRNLYGESFNPLNYSYHTPFFFEEDIYYFEPLDYNSSDYRNNRGIHKRYPDALLDTSDVDDEGWVRYYEWEYVIEDLLPTVPYYVSVTTFDFGHPRKSLKPLETSIEGSMTEVRAVVQGKDIFNNGKLNVYCYPNPYRVDDEYYVHGFENRLDQTGY